MTLDTRYLDERLAYLGGQLRRIDQAIAALSLLAIARRVRTVRPEAVTVGLAWSKDGDCLIPDGYYTADGRRIGYSADGACLDEDLWRSDSWETRLDATLGPYCAELTEINQEVWGAVTDDTDPESGMLLDGATRLKIDEVLAGGEPVLRLTERIMIAWRRWRARTASTSESGH
ncbi:hypothetical protein GCM10010156_49880 [Planobispora rosea]|uniref:Uncharacterized protein n=1 Tax=Planobispora rosea TaxID=35762 RepID=A0A8J3S7Q0_PLARO|nr:hypothetical protein [Planobispora rosea]GGS85281.1 hypothetical protein GCM10010156_49880 [Planobispora rosea]GIH86499.1 hypothetical protein Pro02_49070 [Planobispora rosea]